MKQISEYESAFDLRSPDRRFRASYQGAEYGMGSPTVGHIRLLESETGKPVYSSPSWAEACFSDDSQYLIHGRAGATSASGYRAVVVINCLSGKEEWILEDTSKDGPLEMQNRVFTFSVAGKTVSSLLSFEFDISRSEIELSSAKRHP